MPARPWVPRPKASVWFLVPAPCTNRGRAAQERLLPFAPRVFGDHALQPIRLGLALANRVPVRLVGPAQQTLTVIDDLRVAAARLTPGLRVDAEYLGRQDEH